MSKKTSTTKKKISKKPNTATIVGASLAAVAAAGAYYSYSTGTWPFAAKKTLPGKKIGAKANGVSAADHVDVALTNEVAEATLHNPNNDGEFTDDGATGNAD